MRAAIPLVLFTSVRAMPRCLFASVTVPCPLSVVRSSSRHTCRHGEANAADRAMLHCSRATAIARLLTPDNGPHDTTGGGRQRQQSSRCQMVCMGRGMHGSSLTYVSGVTRRPHPYCNQEPQPCNTTWTTTRKKHGKACRVAVRRARRSARVQCAFRGSVHTCAQCPVPSSVHWTTGEGCRTAETTQAGTLQGVAAVGALY